MEQEQQSYEGARAHMQTLEGFYIYAGAFLLVNIALFAINVLAGGVWWFYWSLGIWNIGLGMHALAVLGFGGGLYRGKRPKPLEVHYSDAPTKVLIVGGGFGGLAVARELARALGGSQKVGVAMLDRVNYTTFSPMVPAAISGDLEVRHAARSIRRIIKPSGAEFLQAEVTGVDFDAREVRTDIGSFPYDYLVLALGSRTAFFDVSGAQENAIDLKGLRDALRIRNTIIERFEEAERLRGSIPDGLLTFVFVGGGPTGVEGVSDSHDLIFDVLEEDYPKVDFGRVRLVLINSGNHILPGLDPSLVRAAEWRLASQKVEVIFNVKATEVRSDAVVLSDGRIIPARTIIWAAGVEPPPLVKDLGVPKDLRGRILVDEFLRVKSSPRVYAVGDSVSMDYEGLLIPALAPAAEQEGATAARNLAAEIEGKVPTAFRYRSLGQLVDLGTSSAVSDVLGVRFSGLLGAIVWRVIHLYELRYNQNRFRVLADWTIDLFSRPDTSKVYKDD
jgi:NADH:ubiquinone reductase (H+-translocating)